MASKEDIIALFDAWNSALQTQKPKKVVELYERDAVLLPTISNQVRHNHEEIEDYFVTFLEREPFGKILEANVRIFSDIAINSGVYNFNFKDGSSVQARYSFVYRWNGREYKIIEHHSSQMPE
ncbi:SgcJ/EcaC family oxidoreductase [Agaribacterium sp. ZY112]|uniref:SgcJ/EcaC family oxidoreductase n=1 Tax=Agaribacterium sp. ZY112 TaxID=3233574 RepID=UPI00352577D0